MGEDSQCNTENVKLILVLAESALAILVHYTAEHSVTVGDAMPLRLVLCLIRLPLGMEHQQELIVTS